MYLCSYIHTNTRTSTSEYIAREEKSVFEFGCTVGRIESAAHLLILQGGVKDGRMTRSALHKGMLRRRGLSGLSGGVCTNK